MNQSGSATEAAPSPVSPVRPRIVLGSNRKTSYRRWRSTIGSSTSGRTPLSIVTQQDQSLGSSSTWLTLLRMIAMNTIRRWTTSSCRAVGPTCALRLAWWALCLRRLLRPAFRCQGRTRPLQRWGWSTCTPRRLQRQRLLKSRRMRMRRRRPAFCRKRDFLSRSSVSTSMQSMQLCLRRRGRPEWRHRRPPSQSLSSLSRQSRRRRGPTQDWEPTQRTRRTMLSTSPRMTLGMLRCASSMRCSVVTASLRRSSMRSIAMNARPRMMS